jgi:hypothetical protein
MRIAKQQVPVMLETKGAVARVQANFGDAQSCGRMNGEYFSLAAGTDITPLLKGLERDLCEAPHWGYLIVGALTVTYADGQQEDVLAGDLFYWPPGHTVRVHDDAEVVLFSPQKEHAPVIEHMRHMLQS